MRRRATTRTTKRKTEAIIAKLGQVKQGLLHDLLTRGIDENGELRDPDRHPEQFKRMGGRIFPLAWELQTLEELCDMVTNGYVGPTRDLYRSAGVPYLVAKNVKPNLLITKPFAFVTPEFNQANARSQLRAGDVLTVQTGTIGDSAVVPPELEGSNCHALIISRVRRDELYAAFLSEYFNASLGKSAFARIATGMAHPHLNSTLVRKLLIPVPPLEEQSEICRLLHSADRQRWGEERSCEKLRVLKHGLMDDLLTGRVRVTPLLEGAAK